MRKNAGLGLIVLPLGVVAFFQACSPLESQKINESSKATLMETSIGESYRSWPNESTTLLNSNKIAGAVVTGDFDADGRLERIFISRSEDQRTPQSVVRIVDDQTLVEIANYYDSLNQPATNQTLAVEPMQNSESSSIVFVDQNAKRVTALEFHNRQVNHRWSAELPESLAQPASGEEYAVKVESPHSEYTIDQYRITTEAGGAPQVAIMADTPTNTSPTPTKNASGPVSTGQASDTSDVNYCTNQFISGKTLKKATAGNLDSVISGAVAGDIIVLADGTYKKGFTLKAKGTASKPIVVRAQNFGKVQFLDTLISLEGHYAVLACMKLHDTKVNIGIYKSSNSDPGTGSRVTRNWLTSDRDIDNGVMIQVHYSNLARIDHNDIGDEKNNFRRTGVMILNQPGGKSRVDHNYFHGSPSGGKEYEAIWLAGSSYSGNFDKTGMLVDHNLFEKWNGDNEVLAVKTSGVTITNNTFKGGKDLNLRFCEGNLIQNNVIEGRGINSYGANHRIIGNKLSSSAYIKVASGSLTRKEVDAGNHTGYMQSVDVIVYGNQGGTIYVGDDDSLAAKLPLAPIGTKLGANTSTIKLNKNQNTQDNFKYSGVVGTPKGVSRSEVGPESQ